MLPKGKKQRKAQPSNLQQEIAKLVREDASIRLKDITAKLFPTIQNQTAAFAAKTKMVKKLLPRDLRNVRWQRRSLWENEVPVDPGLYMQLSAVEEDGRKVVGGKDAPCRCIITSKGTMEVQVYERLWKGWLIEQLVNSGWSADAAQKHVINLRCRSKTSQLNIKLMRLLKGFREFSVRDPESQVELKIKS